MKRYPLTIPANIHLAPALRSIAMCVFQECGFEGSTLSHLQLVFDELFMNAVRYGSTEESNIYITFEFEDPTLQVSLEDEGGEKKISAQELKKIIVAEESNTDLGKQSGRGLAQISSKWADSLKVHDGTRGGICMIFTKILVEGEESVPKIHANTSLKSLPNPHLPLEKLPISGQIDDVTFQKNTEPIDSFIDDIEEPTLLILDFSHLEFCNSTFLAKVADWKQKMKKKNGDLVLQNVPEKIFEIFDLVGMTKMIHITPDEFQKQIHNP